MTNLRIDLVFPRFSCCLAPSGRISGWRGRWWRLVIASVWSATSSTDRVSRASRPASSSSARNLRLEWSRNRYLNAALDYGRCFQLRHLLDPKADVQILFGPSLPLVWYLRKVRTSDAVVLYYCWEPPGSCIRTESWCSLDLAGPAHSWRRCSARTHGSIDGSWSCQTASVPPVRLPRSTYSVAMADLRR